MNKTKRFFFLCFRIAFAIWKKTNNEEEEEEEEEDSN